MDDLRHELLTGIRAVQKMGLFELNTGHLAARIPGRDAYLVPRHLHGEHGVGGFGELGPGDLVEVDLATGSWSEGQEPPDEVYLHTEIFRARADVVAIVHCHPEAPVALSVADVPVVAVHHHGALFAPAVTIYPEHHQIDSPARGRALADALGNDWAIVMRAHGAIAVGGDIREAVAVMFTLDQCARRQLQASQAGTPRPIEVPVGPRPRLSTNTIRNTWFWFAANEP